MSYLHCKSILFVYYIILVCMYCADFLIVQLLFFSCYIYIIQMISYLVCKK